MNRNQTWCIPWIERRAAGRHHACPRFLPAFIATACLFLLNTSAHAAGGTTDNTRAYQPGDGWTVPHTDLTLGGYASSSLTKETSQPWTLDLSHLSLFLWWNGDSRLRFFSETDLENSVQVSARRTSTDGAYLALERLYADWTQSDELNFRIGKFLTPIGRWNLIHAQPLVWTTSRPVITEQVFPTNATGAMIYGTLTAVGAGLDYSVYGSIGKELRPDPDQDTFKEAYGVHFSYPAQPDLQLGLSYASFEQKHEIGEHKNLLGVDGVWTRNGYEISAEAAWRFSSNGGGADEKGGFIQGVIPLADKLYAVGRYEYLQQSGEDNGNSLWLAGMDYRWNRSLIFKTEFSKSEHNNWTHEPGGFLASLAALF